MYFEVDAKHTVYLTYVVPAENWEEAYKKLCSIDLFTTFNGNLAGPCPHAMESVGASVVELSFEADADPSATGTKYCRREWEVREADEDD